jgi:Flp pilus assembly protein TadD
MRAPSLLTFAAAALVVATLAATIPASAQMDRKGVYGTVVDHEDNPLAGVQVVATAKDNTGTAPLKVKSSKKGRFIYPIFHQEQSGWTITATLEGYRVWKFRMVSRNARRELFQDDAGTLAAGGEMPALEFREFGYSEIELVMIPEGMAPPGSAPAQVPLPSGEVAEGAAIEPVPDEGAAARQMRDEAREALEAGDVDAAVTALEKLLEEDPEDHEARLALGKTLRVTGDSSGALRQLSKLARLDPERTEVHLLMGDLQMELGRADQALASYRVERELSGDDPELLQKMAEAAAELGDTETLLEVYQAWAEADPNSPEPLVALATARAEAGDFEGSEELFRQAAALDPAGADTLFYNIGATILNRRPLTAEGRRRAAAAFRKALEANPKHAGAHFRLALTLIGLGEMPEAKEHLRTYLDLAPNGPEAKNAREMLESL